jgi:hypothetical protein
VASSHLAKVSVEEHNLTAPAKSPSSNLEETLAARCSKYVFSDGDLPFLDVLELKRDSGDNDSASICRLTNVDNFQRCPPRDGTRKQDFGKANKRTQQSISFVVVRLLRICDSFVAAWFLEA